MPMSSLYCLAFIFVMLILDFATQKSVIPVFSTFMVKIRHNLNVACVPHACRMHVTYMQTLTQPTKNICNHLVHVHTTLVNTLSDSRQYFRKLLL